MSKKSFLKEASEFHIKAFNYVIHEGAHNCCLDIDPVSTETTPPVKISICDAEMKALSFPMDTRKHKKPIYPSQTRMWKSTYYAELLLRLSFESSGEVVNTERSFFIPLMVKSDLCLLSGLNESKLSEVLEDPDDPGGYFIVNGTERIIRQFLVPRRNFPIALKDSKFKKLHPGFTDNAILIRSVKDNHTNKNVYLHYHVGGFVKIGIKINKRKCYIDLMLIMKALKDDTDLNIVEEIMKFRSDDRYLRQILIKMLRNCYDFDHIDKTCNKICSQKDVKSWLGSQKDIKSLFKSSSFSSSEITDYILRKLLLIHLTSYDDKFLFLSYALCKLFSLVSNEFKPEDIDNPVFQEVLTGGQFYLMALKDGANYYLNSVKNSLTRAIKQEPTYNLKACAQRSTNFALSLSPRIKNVLSTGNLPSAWENGLSSDTGYTVLMKRTNLFDTAAQYLSVNKFSMMFYGKNMRKFYPESWGFLCPAQTPEGENTGLHNYLSSACQIVNLSATRIEPKLIFRFGAVPLDDPLTLPEKDKCMVFVDGETFGWVRHDKTNHFLAQLKYIRHLNRLAVSSTIKTRIPSSVEIVHVPESNSIVYPGIYIFSNPCRFSRRVKRKDKKARLGIFEQLYCRDYEELKDSNILSVAAGVIPFLENNPAVRTTFSCVKIKQAISAPLRNAKHRADTKRMESTYPQIPLVATTVYDRYNFDENPMGTNLIIAVMSYSGYDMEDAIVLSKSAVERGLMRDIVHKTLIFDMKDLANELHCNPSELDFGVDPKDPHISQSLDLEGLPYVGKDIFPNEPILSVSMKNSGKFNIKLFKENKRAIIESVRFMRVNPTTATKKLPEEIQKIAITYSYKRIPEAGDKFNNRHGQKGICGYLMPAEDLPFSESGIVPDILFNPHGLPSRMSVGMMLEIMASKSAMVRGEIYHGIEPFGSTAETESTSETIGNLLKQAGLDFYGTEKFYSGTSGRELEANIFCGSVYYLRLHHVVDEKYQVSSKNEVDPATRQPINTHSGALRFGEMERDAILAHGAMECTMDRLLKNSDECIAVICSQCRVLIQPLLMNYSIVERNDREELQHLAEKFEVCQLCQSTNNYLIKIPHLFVYLMSELSAIGIKVKFSEGDNVQEKY